MNAETRFALNAINRDFYANQASGTSFSETRDHAWPGWARVWQRVQHAAEKRAAANPDFAPPLSVLDAGCGNGRFAGFLAGRSPDLHYVGVDASQLLLERAAERAEPLASAQFICSDLTDETHSALQGAPARFDLIVLFGVLHHIPSFADREKLLVGLADRLAAGGILAFTLWRFGEKSRWPRFQKRVLPWSDYNRTTQTPLDLSELEAGDHLLRWGDGETGDGAGAAGPLRYCHYSDESERDALVAALPLEAIDRYTEDGRSRDLNDYVVLGAAKG